MNVLVRLSFSKQKHLVVGRFDAYQDGTLTKAETAAYRQHLATCQACRTRYVQDAYAIDHGSCPSCEIEAQGRRS